MTTRITQSTTFSLLKKNFADNLYKMYRAQEQVSSGKRILRPSDAPADSANALALRRRIGDVDSFRGGANAAKPIVEQGMGVLSDATELLSQARTLVVQGANGTLSDEDRRTIGAQLLGLRDRLLEIANTRTNEEWMFGGTRSDAAPFVERNVGSTKRVVYEGDEAVRRVALGPDVTSEIVAAGSQIFAKNEPSGLTIEGVTGAVAGASASQGTGAEKVYVRHVATTGTLGSGLAFAGGGAQDTFIGDRSIVVDAAAGTIQFGSGTAVEFPAVGAPDRSNFTMKDDRGAEIHIDFTGYDSTSSTSTATASGAISIDGTTFTAIDPTEDNLELTNAETNSIVRVDVRGVVRAGIDLATFEGTENTFDVLQGLADDFMNADGLDAGARERRFSARLDELGRNTENVLSALGKLGSQANRFDNIDASLEERGLQLQTLLSGLEDADLSTAVVDLTRAEQTLQVVQSTGSRLIQTSFLNYLR